VIQAWAQGHETLFFSAYTDLAYALLETVTHQHVPAISGGPLEPWKEHQNNGMKLMRVTLEWPYGQVKTKCGCLQNKHRGTKLLNRNREKNETTLQEVRVCFFF